jgi:ribosomal 30S subunit maturation factor RimM
MEAQIGDQIIVESNKVGQGRRVGDVVDVLKGSAGLHFRVRWDNGQETVLYPSSDAVVVHPDRRQ